jgi:hypothetical protein
LSIRQITEKLLVFQRQGPDYLGWPTLYRDWLWAARARLVAALAYALLSIERGCGAAQPFVDFHALDEEAVTWSIAWAG